MKSKLCFRSALGVGLLMLAFSVALSAPPTLGNANIRGTVSRQSRPLRSVWVIVSQNGAEKGRALTGDDGQYYIGNLDTGGYQIVVMAGARELFRASVNLPANQRYDIGMG